MEKKLVDDLFERADRLETKLNTASENGLFEDQSEVTHRAILDQITAALELGLRKELSPAEFSRGIVALDTAQNLFDKAIEAVSLGKKLNYVYGIPTLLYMLLVLALIASTVLWRIPDLSTPLSFLTIPKKILVAGAVGAILRGIALLWYNVNRREYRKLWATWYLLCPVMGALLGGFVYLAFFATIVTTTLTLNFANPSLAILIAILAGYNWEWAKDILEKLAKVFTAKEA